MSITIMGMVWKTPLEQTTKLVLLALADWSNETGGCWPSTHLIAQRASTSERNLRKIMANLDQSGLVSRRHRGRGGVLYQINLDMLSSLTNQVEKGGTPVPCFAGEKAALQFPLPEKRRNSSSEKAALQFPQNLKNLESKDSSPLFTPTPSCENQLATPPVTPAKPMTSKKNGPPDLGEHTWFCRWWGYSYERITGSRYAFQKGKDGKIVKELLAGIGFDDMLDRAVTYLLTPETRRWPKGSPTLGGLQSMVNQLGGKFDGETEAKAISAGLLPDDDATLGYCGYWTPWETNEENVA